MHRAPAASETYGAGDQGQRYAFHSRERMVESVPLPLLDRSLKPGINTGY
jgi:hypothetical protein